MCLLFLCFCNQNVLPYGSTISTETELQMQPWSRSIRAAIIEVMDIKISLLGEVVESCRFEAEIEELVEIVRAFDILVAEKKAIRI
jgi:phosphopantothenate synthetase